MYLATLDMARSGRDLMDDVRDVLMCFFFRKRKENRDACERGLKGGLNKQSMPNLRAYQIPL